MLWQVILKTVLLGAKIKMLQSLLNNPPSHGHHSNVLQPEILTELRTWPVRMMELEHLMMWMESSQDMS